MTTVPESAYVAGCRAAWNLPCCDAYEDELRTAIAAAAPEIARAAKIEVLRTVAEEFKRLPWVEAGLLMRVNAYEAKS